MDREDFDKRNVFGLGAENSAYAQYFIGKSYLNPLTTAGKAPFFANVTFEPGCRNNWHIHRGEKRRRTDTFMRCRQRLVPRMGKACDQLESRRRGRDPRQRKTLARREKGQLVFAYRSRNARRGNVERMAGTRVRRGI